MQSGGHNKYPRSNVIQTSLINAQTGVYTSDFVLVPQFMNITVTVVYDATFAGTIKFYGSTQTTTPDLDASFSATNAYSTIAFARTDTGEIVSGNTGLVIAGGTAGCVNVVLQCDIIRWLASAATVVGTPGTYSVSYIGANNQ